MISEQTNVKCEFKVSIFSMVNLLIDNRSDYDQKFLQIDKIFARSLAAFVQKKVVYVLSL